MGYLIKRPIKSKPMRRSLFSSTKTPHFYPERRREEEQTVMAAVVFTVASPVSPSTSSLRSTRRDRETSSSSSSLSISLSSSSSFSQFPSLSFSATQQRNHCGYVVVSCLPSSSSPKSSNSFSPRLYVSGLSFRTTEESLRNAFQNFGELVEMNLVMDRIANRPRGFAFLRYETEEESKKAIEGMHGKFLDGRVIFVEVAKPKSEMNRLKKTPTQYG